MEINQIYNLNCLDLMGQMPDGFVNTIITSPPYWNQKEYSFWPTYSDYLADVHKWVTECYRVLEPGRHCFWVIPDKLPWPPKESGYKERMYMPVYADTEYLASGVGFVPEFPIIWKKPHGSQKMFGSYPYPPTVIHTPMTERICVWRKPGKYVKRHKLTKEASKFDKETWVDFAQDLWEIRPETGSKHPAAFPLELPRRILHLWTFVGDLVYDPFMGSGTTACAAYITDRSYVGSELVAEYVELAEVNINATIAEYSI